MLNRSLFHLYLYSKLVRRDTERSADCGHKLFSGYRLELEYRGAADYGVIDVKIRILRCGGDKSYLSVFDVFQQGLLLLFVEVLYLVQIKQHAVNAVQGVGVGYNVLDIGNGRGGTVQLVKLHMGIFGNYACNGCFTHSGTAVKYHVRYLSVFDYTAQGLSLA